MLCVICHRLLHSGLRSIPDSIERFDICRSGYLTPQQEHGKYYDQCPVCGGTKYKRLKSCSIRCANVIKSNGVTPEELRVLYDRLGSYEAVGSLLGISGRAVSRRLSRYPLASLEQKAMLAALESLQTKDMAEKIEGLLGERKAERRMFDSF